MTAMAEMGGPTFGEMLAESGFLEANSRMTREIIATYVQSVDNYVRVHLSVVSCHDCNAPKACCHLKTKAYLHEAVVIAARLKREERDTPELRAQLKQAAHYMETTPKTKHTRGCVFLDADERCTIYEDRPAVCGSHFVSSPPEQCGGGPGNVTKLVSERHEQIPASVEQQFVAQAGLRRIDRHYAGALPRMILICLEAWDRRDYVPFLAERCLPAAHRFDQITAR
jgi:Fe-S-cluster containining protein